MTAAASDPWAQLRIMPETVGVGASLFKDSSLAGHDRASPVGSRRSRHRRPPLCRAASNAELGEYPGVVFP